jgi:hypothetical protein
MALERFADTLRGVLHFDQLPFVQSLLPFATRLAPAKTPLSEQQERLDANRITELLYPGSEQDREFRKQSSAS